MNPPLFDVTSVHNFQTLNHTRLCMRRGFCAVIIATLFLLQPWVTTNQDLFDNKSSQSYNEDQVFNQTGFYEDGVYTTPDGESHVTRPHIQWTTPNQGLVGIKTGACSVAIDSLNEVWIFGGRADPNPSQGGDEMPSDMVEVLDNVNKTWLPAQTNMPFTQQYCEAGIVGDQIYIVGDWLRNSNPAEFSTGKVQIYNLSNDTWFNGSSMPAGNERGLGGMAEKNGYLYYAGGVRNTAGTDATNRTYRYDTANDQWTRMADMNQPRASFELINFHGQLYAMGGFQGTQSWNRQALDYVERYDSASDTWTNLSALPKAMFGWGGTVLNDEIVLVGGFNGGTKKSVYHWNPIEDTWSAGNDIGTPGHFDLEVEEINGSIVWASGDMSTYPYSSWGQMFSAETEYQNATDLHSGWITSPVIDLRPNANARATPVQFELLGSNTPGGELSFQFRANYDAISVVGSEWIGSDGTTNTTYPIGITDIELADYADFIQYRIRMSVMDLANWDEPNLDSISIRAEHAAFTSSIPTVLHPRAETVNIQTSHDIITAGEMYVSLAACDSVGAVSGPSSKLSHDGTEFTETDTQGLFIQSTGNINSSNLGETIIDWTFDLSDLTGIQYLCIKVGSIGAESTEFSYTSAIQIDNTLEVSITDLGQFESGDAITGGIPLNIGLKHTFLSSGMTLSSGNIQARIIFNIHGLDPIINNYTSWVNQTTPWTNLTIGQLDIIPWTLPNDISGQVEIVLESRSDQSFQMLSNSNSSWLILDNDNPVIIASTPTKGSYVNSVEDRELSLLIADTSGFISEEMNLEIWVQGLDDGTDGSFPDAIVQEEEYRVINHTLENNGSLWWFNATHSDIMNSDHDLVYLRIIGSDIVGSTTQNNTIWWQTRDAQNSVIESLSNEDQVQFWEVSRDITWNITISDANAISDVMSLQIELGGDSEFGISYSIADSTCSSFDSRIDSDRTLCSQSYEGDNMVISVTLFAGWNVDRSALSEGMVEIFVEDLDGISKTTYQNLWIFSEDFDFQINMAEDISGPVTGQIDNDSIIITGEEIQLSGSMTHSLSGLPYQGDLSITWWGQLQGQNWFGAGTISVVDGIINASIPMPSTGGILDMSVAFMDPLETRTLGVYEVPVFRVDAGAPIIMESSTEGYSRYHLESIGIGVNIVEEVSWSNELDLTCQISSTDFNWPTITISMIPATVFQGKTLFSFSFDFSQQGDPSLLSPEAYIYCWATGKDDAGWDLISSTDNSLIEPWLTIPLSTEGPNLELVEVKLTGDAEPGNPMKIEISVLNSGESLQDSFNITVYTISNNERILAGRHTQSQLSSGQGITKFVSVTVPEDDWTLEVIVDEEQNIWELNEDDNSFYKDYAAPEEFNTGLYMGIGSGIIALFALGVILKRKSGDELLQSPKKMPALDELPRSGPPEATKSKTPSSAKPKKGPPPKPKPEYIPVDEPVPNITEAMSKLSLDSLPGKSNPQPEKIASFEYLPGGGEYEYLGEGTFYSGESIGRWRLEEDGTFTKVE
jgi:hypothetical protein